MDRYMPRIGEKGEKGGKIKERVRRMDMARVVAFSFDFEILSGLAEKFCPFWYLLPSQS